ncbi:MAG: carbamoyltransferase C-terminal domain-containing protein [Candidatus Helarchaeota archaeon]
MNIIAFHTLHDANLSISEKGKIKLILELERYYNKRYFASSWNKKEFKKQWKDVIDFALNFTNIKTFDIAITSWVLPSFQNILKELVTATKWITVDHHYAHATYGFFQSKFNNAIILSYDGGGNDGTFNLYYANNNKIHLIEWKPLNLGTAYRLLAKCMPEIRKIQPQPRNGDLTLAGKIMGYSAYGKIKKEWIPAIKEYYLKFQTPLQALYTLGNKLDLNLEYNRLDIKNSRDLAKTSQYVFEEIVLSYLKKKIKNFDVEGIVITGGCALNILTNTRIKEELGIQTYVPPAPNDSSISSGAIWAIKPPLEHQQITYLGMPLIKDIDLNYLEDLNPIKNPSMKYLANLLAQGKIIGVAKGRSEIGPRALGNRSILCYPDKIEIKERLNKEIKFREWFRPFAPIIHEDATDLFFGKKFKSPFMNFCYKLKDILRNKFPAIVHIDGTVRVQTVNSRENKWIYELLEEIKKILGYPILLNTSFNSKGKPLLSRYSTALKILKNTSLDYVLLEDYLISKEMLDIE